MEIKRSTARLLVLVIDFDSNFYDSAIGFNVSGEGTGNSVRAVCIDIHHQSSI